MKTFIDISGHNSEFLKNPKNAFKCTKDCGHVGVYVKATEGLTYYLDDFVDLVNEANEAQLLVGAYHFARPDPREDDYKKEADYFLSKIAGVPLGMPSVLDLELSDWGLNDPKKLTQWAKNWLDYVADKTGLEVMLYTGPNFWKVHLNKTQELNNYKLWVAAYPSVEPKLDAIPPSLGNWKPFAWQYSSKGTIKGLKGNVDVNRLYGDL